MDKMKKLWIIIIFLLQLTVLIFGEIPTENARNERHIEEIAMLSRLFIVDATRLYGDNAYQNIGSIANDAYTIKDILLNEAQQRGITPQEQNSVILNIDERYSTTNLTQETFKQGIIKYIFTQNIKEFIVIKSLLEQWYQEGQFKTKPDFDRFFIEKIEPLYNQPVTYQATALIKMDTHLSSSCEISEGSGRALNYHQVPTSPNRDIDSAFVLVNLHGALSQTLWDEFKSFTAANIQYKTLFETAEYNRFNYKIESGIQFPDMSHIKIAPFIFLKNSNHWEENFYSTPTYSYTYWSYGGELPIEYHVQKVIFNLNYGFDNKNFVKGLGKNYKESWLQFGFNTRLQDSNSYFSGYFKQGFKQFSTELEVSTNATLLNTFRIDTPQDIGIRFTWIQPNFFELGYRIIRDPEVHYTAYNGDGASITYHTTIGEDIAVKLSAEGLRTTFLYQAIIASGNIVTSANVDSIPKLSNTLLTMDLDISKPLQLFKQTVRLLLHIQAFDLRSNQPSLCTMTSMIYYGVRWVF